MNNSSFQLYYYVSFFIILFNLDLILYLNFANGQQIDTTFLNQCKMELTSGYGYHNFYRLADIAEHSEADSGALVFHFFVKTKNDAHIILTTKQFYGVKPGDAIYEIVLGANRNTYSVIRRARQGVAKSSVMTNKIVSGSEARGFWIRFNKKSGLIQVGYRNNSIPFIFYRDSNPLDTRYISFSSWTDTFGYWFYDCPTNQQEQNEIESVNRPMSQSGLLRNSILLDYDPYAVPESEDGSPLTIFANFLFNHIALDERYGILSVHGIVHFHWAEDKIKWNSSDFGNLSSIRLGKRALWTPEFYLFNSIDHGADPFNSAPMLITSEGMVLWSPIIEFKTRCNVDVSQWPSDTQLCPIIFGFWSQSDKLRLVIYQNNNETIWTELKSGTEWKLLELNNEIVNIENSPYTDVTDEPHVSLQLNLKLTRTQKNYRIIFYTPLIVTSLLGMISFWMSSKKSTRILIPCMDLFILSVVILVINNAIPGGTRHTPKLLKVYEWNLLGALFALITGIISVRLIRFSPKFQPPLKIYKILQNKAIQISLQLPQFKGASSYNHLDDNSRLNDSMTIVEENLTDEEIEQFWKIIATTLDRISFLIYTIAIPIELSII